MLEDEKAFPFDKFVMRDVMFIVQCVMTHCAMNTNNEHDVGLSEYAKFDNYKTITMTRMTCVHDEHDNYDKYDAINMTCLNILGCEREVASCAVKSLAPMPRSTCLLVSS